MVTQTDPARELAEICVRLQGNADARGDDWLAAKFGVKAWSKEFYEIVFCIVERADFLISIINELDLDEDFKGEAAQHVEAVKTAFSQRALSSPWKVVGAKAVDRENVQPLKMLAQTVRQKVSYPKLSDEEHDDLLADVDELIGWLEEHQIRDQDFIRQALLEGLKHFRFRLAHVGWLGWGYTLDSLREVIGAYMAMERGLDPDVDPVAKAALQKVAAFVRDFYEKTKSFKDIVDTGDFLLRAYGAASLVSTTGGLAGLLPAG